VEEKDRGREQGEDGKWREQGSGERREEKGNKGGARD